MLHTCTYLSVHFVCLYSYTAESLQHFSQDDWPFSRIPSLFFVSIGVTNHGSPRDCSVISFDTFLYSPPFIYSSYLLQSQKQFRTHYCGLRIPADSPLIPSLPLFPGNVTGWWLNPLPFSFFLMVFQKPSPIRVPLAPHPSVSQDTTDFLIAFSMY